MALTEGEKKLSAIDHTGSQCPDTILFLQMPVVMLELISWDGGQKWTVNTLNHPDERRLLYSASKGRSLCRLQAATPTQP